VPSLPARTEGSRPAGILLVSERMPLFGFQDYGYRAAIVTALAAEAATVVFLGAYLGARMRRR
jgi:hypothetical protein